MRGEGPLGRERGDRDHWGISLSGCRTMGKIQSIAEKVKIAVNTKFNEHYYTFGGRKYHQSRVGPIGLRWKVGEQIEGIGC